ncbi:MAG: hypothetical protein HY815_27840 [Candidatus Riflebacteria bacterium]|nr:hypothetical protein [Candidatus Riflebacteria bacterium]
MTSLAEYLIGWLGLVMMLAMALWCSCRLTGALGTGLARDEWLVAWGVVFSSLVTATVLVVGLLGHLDLPAVLVALTAVCLIVSRFTVARTVPTPDQGRGRPWRGFIGVMALVAAACLGCWSARGLVTPPCSWDSVIYHLPFAVRWVQTGSLAGHVSVTHTSAVAYYPSGHETLVSCALLPLHNELLVSLVNLPYVILAGLAIMAIARRLGAHEDLARCAGLAFLFVPELYRSQLNTAYNDIYLTFAFLAATLFAVGDRSESSGWRRCVLFGLAIGLALGTKYLAVPHVGVVVILFLARHAGPGRSIGRAVAALSIISICALATGGFWYIRNALVTSNPFYPLGASRVAADHTGAQVPLGEDTLLAGLADAPVMGQYAGVATRCLGPLYLVCLVGCVVVAIQRCSLAWRIRRETTMEPRPGDAAGDAVLVAFPLVLFVAYAATPWTGFSPMDLNIRYAFPLYGCLLGFFAAFLAARPFVMEAARSALLLTALVSISYQRQLRPFLVPDPWLVLPVCLGAVIVTHRLLVSDAEEAQFGWRSVGCLVLGAVVLLRLAEARHYSPDFRYEACLKSYHSSWVQGGCRWVEDNLTGKRIGLAGTGTAHFFVGKRFENVVLPVLGDGEIGLLPHERRVPGTTDRPDLRMLAGVRQHKLDYLVTLTGVVPAQSHFPAADTWASGRPDVFRLVYSDKTCRIYEVLR